MINLKKLVRGQILKSEQDALKGYYIIKDLPIVLDLIWARKTNTLFFADMSIKETEKEFKQETYIAEDQVLARKEIIRLVYTAMSVKPSDIAEVFKSI
jgi:hypothetical protein